MIQYFIRLIKRLVVLSPGLVVAYFSVRTVFPFIHHKIKLSDAFSILVTYVVAAYILIPAIIRIWRIIKPPNHLPVYCVTPDGFASDPINIGLIATRRELITAMEKAGWYMADAYTPKSVVKHLFSILFGSSYPTAPMSSLFLFGRKQDISFEIPSGSSSASRHHVRFWATTFEDKRPLTFRSIHWHQRRAHVFGDNLLWVGAASLDVGINIIRHNMQFTHMVDPDTNQERELIVDQLKAQNIANKVEIIQLRKPYRLVNRVWNGSLSTDGKLAVVSLK